MAQVEGTVQGVRSNQEGKDVVLRFVLHAGDDDRIPVELRDSQV